MSRLFNALVQQLFAVRKLDSYICVDIFVGRTQNGTGASDFAEDLQRTIDNSMVALLI